MSSEKINGPVASDDDQKPLPDEINNPFFHPVSNRFGKLPPLLNHFNVKDLKILFKCSLTVWIYMLFLVINPTLRALGQATFFGAILLFIVPPSGVVLINLMMASTLLLGICLAWAWGTITMKAALATRPAADLQRRFAQLQQAASASTTNPEQASGQSTFAQIAIFQGFMLDARVSATYFSMMGLFIYFMARLRVKAPKFTLTSIFSMIISDLYLTIAPLIPQFQGTIAQTLIKPAAIATGISLVCNILFFPQSTSHIVLDGMQGLMAPMSTFIDASFIHFQQPNKNLRLDRLSQIKAQVAGAYKGVEASLGFLSLEASMGRWSAQDVSSLHDPLRRVMITFIGLIQLHIGRQEFKIKDEKLLDMAEEFKANPMGDKKAGHHQIARSFDFRQRFKTEESDRLREQSLKALATSSRDVLDACKEAVAAIKESLRFCNTRRWFNRPSAEECNDVYKGHLVTLEKLRRHKDLFANLAAEHLWDPHKHLFDADGHLKSDGQSNKPPPAGGIMLGMVFQEKIYNYANALDVFLTRVVELEQQRTKTRLWLPAGLNKLFSWALADDPVATTLSETSDEPTSLKQEKKHLRKKGRKKDDNTGPERSAAAQLRDMRAHGGLQRSKAGNFIVDTIHWFTSTEAMFALRVVVVTVAVGVPAVIPHTAGFYYREKGLWALIMAQVGLLPYTADFVFGLITRVIGTVIGAVLGCLAWYIGAGNGPGNPYGIAAVMAVAIVILMWLRLYSPPAMLQGIILTSATFFLVVGYSWSDTHIPSYGNPGYGYSVFWRRMALVLVGFAAAAIVTFFPRPPSANRHMRRLISENIGAFKNRYALFAANCNNPLPDLRQVSEEATLQSSQVLTQLVPQTKMLKFEFSTSNFNAETIEVVAHLCMNLNQAVMQLILYTPLLSDGLRNHFVRVTGCLEEQLVADIMAVLTLLQQCLINGEPLPMILPVPLLARSVDSIPSRVKGHNRETAVFNQQLLAQEGIKKYCSAMAAWVMFLSSIDELVLVVKKAVGETGYFEIHKHDV